ncbi:hypothetical protein BDR04DRAFT_693545 [Suillus decipiens]|nr:hypothetical protein BDR04DRAFT_693545 [Suillus decipiens]
MRVFHQAVFISAGARASHKCHIIKFFAQTDGHVRAPMPHIGNVNFRSLDALPYLHAFRSSKFPLSFQVILLVNSMSTGRWNVSQFNIYQIQSSTFFNQITVGWYSRTDVMALNN